MNVSNRELVFLALGLLVGSLTGFAVGAFMVLRDALDEDEP